MKSIKQIALVLCIGLMIIFNSCKEKSLPPHLKAIPEDAFFVVALDIKQMSSKGGQDFNFFDKINEVDEVTKNLIAEFTKNPKSLGIDLDMAYLFGVKQDVGVFIAMALKMDKASAFESNVKKLVQANIGEDVPVEDNGAYKIINIDEVSIAWNNELLIVGAEEFSSEFDYNRLFVPGNKTIANVPDFIEFNKRNYDIGGWMAYNEILNMTDAFSNLENFPLLKEIQDMYLHAYLNFDDGEMKFSFVTTPQSKIKEFFKKYPIIGKNFDNSLLNAFPEKSYLTYKQSLNFSEYLKMMKDISGQMDAYSKSSFDQIFDNPEVSAIFNGLGGDMILSVYGFAQGPLPIPLAGFAFNVNSEADFNRLLEMIPQGMATFNGDYYVVSTGLMVSFYFAFKDNKIYVTDDADAIVAFTGKGYGKSLNSTALGKSLYYFYLNLDADSYPENVRTMLQKEAGSYIGTEPLKYLKPYKDFSITINDDNESVISLKFKDTRQNSLKQILKFVDETTAGKF